MSVDSASSEKASAATVKRVTAADLKQALVHIADAVALLGGEKVAHGVKKTPTKGTNRGLVKTHLQRQAALAVLIAEWEEIDEEVRAETHTVTKTSAKTGKVTTKEVLRHPKPTYKDAISLFKKDGRELPEVEDEAIEEAWAAAQAKREHELSVASEASEADAAEEAPVVTPAKKPAKKSTDAPKKAAAAAPTAATPAKKPAAAPAAAGGAGKPAAKPAAAPAAAKPAAKPAASSEKKIAEIENDEGIKCTVFEFKKKNYIRYPTGHCWSAKKDGDDWGFGEWAGMWMGNAIDASVAEPECEEDGEEGEWE